MCVNFSLSSDFGKRILLLHNTCVRNYERLDSGIGDGYIDDRDNYVKCLGKGVQYEIILVQYFDPERGFEKLQPMVS